MKQMITRQYKKKRKILDYQIEMDKADMHWTHMDRYGFEQNVIMESCMIMEDLLYEVHTKESLTR